MSKKKGNLETILGGVFEVEEQDWAIPVPIDAEEAAELYGEALAADSDWLVAAPAEPLATIAEPVIESAPRIWDGPVKDAPKTKFDELFDPELLAEWLGRVPSYLEKEERLDPFDLARLAITIEDGSFSTFLARNILTFKDALDHAMQLCFYWHREDNEAPAEKECASEFVVETAHTQEKRKIWKDAVARRKRIVAKLDKIVADAREEYRRAKAGDK